MIRINLLPPDERRRPERLHYFFPAAAGVVLLLFLLISLVQWWQAVSLERQSRELASQYQLLRPSVEKMNAANEKANMINAKNTVLQALSNGRPVWYGALTRMGVIIPSGVWLTDFEPGEKAAIKIKGMAAEYGQLSQLLARLSGDEIFADPVLVSADADQSSGATKFEITVKLKGR